MPAKLELEVESAQVPAWAVQLTRLMDDALRVPGTEIGVGLDALIGFVFPGFGDAAGAIVSLALFVVAFQLRVPKVVMLRMLLNVALDALIGAVPLLGDLLDIFYRANQKNLTLLRRYEGRPARRATLGDYLFVGLGLSLVLAAALLPIVVVLLLWRAVART